MPFNDDKFAESDIVSAIDEAHAFLRDVSPGNEGITLDEINARKVERIHHDGRRCLNLQPTVEDVSDDTDQMDDDNQANDALEYLLNNPDDMSFDHNESNNESATYDEINANHQDKSSLSNLQPTVEDESEDTETENYGNEHAHALEYLLDDHGNSWPGCNAPHVEQYPSHQPTKDMESNWSALELCSPPGDVFQSKKPPC